MDSAIVWLRLSCSLRQFFSLCGCGDTGATGNVVPDSSLSGMSQMDMRSMKMPGSEGDGERSYEHTSCTGE